jgi:hypothetical protein
LKRSRTGPALIVIGALLIALAPAWLFGIGPLFIKLPADLKVDTAYAGKLTLYADRVTSKFYPPGQEVVVPLSIQARDHAVPSKGSPRVLVMDERVAVTDSSTGQPLEGVRPNAIYAIDRKTCENVPGYIEGIDRSGYSLTFPIGSKKKSYPMWDDELGRSVICDFTREAKMDGNKYKGVTVYVYDMPGDMEKMSKPPPGLPEMMTGKKLKEISGRSDLPVPDGAEMTLEYFKKTELTQYVEPRTGMVVYVPRNHYEYYVKNAPGASPAYIKLAAIDYTRALANARDGIDASAKYFRLLDLDQKWTPLSFLVGGCVLLLIGVTLTIRARMGRSGEAEADAPEL